jgi:DNA primase
LNTLKSKKLKEYLNKRKITQDIIDRYNIGYTQWDGEDKFMRNRIIVPSYDEFGMLNYWVGRDFSGYEKAIKYKNCDADKKEIVFNEGLINYNADIVLVEGIIDSIYLPNAIPLMGKFLKKDSELYRKLYKKSNGKIIICLDSDTTIEETKRIYNLLNVGRLRNRVRYIQMENYKDFGEVYETWGKKGIIELLKSSKKFDEIDLLI